MSKSLIRKNQLHPDITDLVGQYGSGYFISIESSGDLINELQDTISQNLNFAVQITGDQTINGVKTFTSRPIVNGTGVLLSGETNLDSTVRLTGNQIVEGIKTFIQRPTFNGSGLATTGEINQGVSTLFDGNRPITADVIGFKNQIPGGNDVVEFLNNVFYPFISGSITLNSFPTQELGKTTTTIGFVGTINTGSLNLNQFTNVEGYVNDVKKLPLLFPVVQNFNFNVAVNLSATSNNVYIKATGANQVGSPIEIKSNVRSIVFEAPTFAGSGIDNLQNSPSDLKTVLSGQNILGGNNGKTVMQEPSSFQVQVYTNNSWFYFVYPSGWGALTRIANPQLGDFDINTDFTQGFVTLTLDNGITTHPYRYYKRNLPTTLTNYPVIYYF